MSSTRSRPRGPLRLFLGLAVLALLALGFVRLGTFFWRNDTLAHADVIHVLAGSRMERPLEAAMLYREGYSPLLLFTQEAPDPAESYLLKEGVPPVSGAEYARRQLLRFGIPASAILVPPDAHDNTAQEATTLRRLAVQRGWRTIILVTSGYHTRRSGYAFARALRGTNITLIVRASRFDVSQPARWWRSRSDVHWILSEGPKMAAYLLGLSD